MLLTILLGAITALATFPPAGTLVVIPAIKMQFQLVQAATFKEVCAEAVQLLPLCYNISYHKIKLFLTAVVCTIAGREIPARQT